MMRRRLAMRRERGQVALETMIVLVPWLIVSTMFFNLLFLLASMMLNQATVNRGAQQAAALSCLPAELERDLESRSGLGLHGMRVVALTPQTRPGQQVTEWNRADYFDDQGQAVARPGVARYLDDCSSADARVESGNYILVQASYEQRLWVLGGLEMLGLVDDDSVRIRTQALTVSNALEGER